MVLLSRTKQITVGVDRGHMVRKVKWRERQQKSLGEQTRGMEEERNTVYRRVGRKIKMRVFNWLPTFESTFMSAHLNIIQI